MTAPATRRQFLQAGAATTAIACLARVAGGEESPQRSVNEVRENTLRFIESMRLADGAYGREQLAAGATEGAMFPTWFRTLTLAYLAKALPDSVVGQSDWQFCDCPGLQF